MEAAKKKKGFKLPHVYVLLLCIMLFVVILSWIVPSGEYSRVMNPDTKVEAIDPDNFNYIDKTNPITLLDFFKAIHNGVVQSGDVIVLLLLSSGMIALLQSTGSITAGVNKVISVSDGKEMLVVAIITLVFTVLGAVGFGEGGIPLVPIGMSVVMALGYDRMLAAGTAMIGLCIGFASGLVNMYTTGIAQSIVGLPLFSGIGFRAFALVIFYIVSVLYLMSYGRKIKKDPSKSIVADEYVNSIGGEKAAVEEVEFSWKRKLLLVGFVVQLILQPYGSMNWGWGMPELDAVALTYAVFIVIVYRMDVNKACVEFAKGAMNILPAALTIGIARGVVLLMNQAKIVDTAIFHLANIFQGKSMVTVLFLVYVVVVGFNFFVVSGSGKAVILMPILGPLAQITKINQQVMVLAYQYGDGFTNYFWPTSGGLMAILELCKLEWQDWVKFSAKLFLILSLVSIGLIIGAQYMNLGPF